MSKALFRQNPDGTFDLEVDRRTVDHDLSEDELQEALRRRRYDGDPAEVEDLSGYRTRLGR